MGSSPHTSVRRRAARSLALAAVAAQCVLCAVARAEETETDDAFAFVDDVAPAANDGPPELLAYQSYMGYLNKAVPLLGLAMLFFIYFGMGSLDPANKIQGPKVHVSHILVEDEPTADAIRKEIKNAPKKTQKFAELAARKSKCPSKSKGGHMGVFGKGQMMPEFDKIVFTEPVGSLHVVKTKFGWHVVLITKREETASDLKRKKH